MTTHPMSGATFRVIREGLGLTVAWVAQELDVRESVVERWERGTHRIPDGVVSDLLQWREDASTLVLQYVEELAGEPGPAIHAYRTNDDWRRANPGSIYPASWHRAVVGRVLDRIPNLGVDYAS